MKSIIKKISLLFLTIFSLHSLQLKTYETNYKTNHDYEYRIACENKNRAIQKYQSMVKEYDRLNRQAIEEKWTENDGKYFSGKINLIFTKVEEAYKVLQAAELLEKSAISYKLAVKDWDSSQIEVLKSEWASVDRKLINEESNRIYTAMETAWVKLCEAKERYESTNKQACDKINLLTKPTYMATLTAILYRLKNKISIILSRFI